MANQSYQKPSLGSCLMMDGIGMASYLFPGLGEGIDFVWAPIAGFIFYKYFHSVAGSVGAVAEELITFTDIVPSFTLGYFLCESND